MIKEIFPEGQAIIRYQPCTTALFNRTVDEIDKAGESFIGIIRIDEPDASYFLFFLRGDAYAAGYIKDGKPMPLSIKDFINLQIYTRAVLHLEYFILERHLEYYQFTPLQRILGREQQSALADIEGLGPFDNFFGRVFEFERITDGVPYKMSLLFCIEHFNRR